jgi:hypothetical protein
VIQSDIPEIKQDALALVERQGMMEILRCARMALGKSPVLPDYETSGATTFELG